MDGRACVSLEFGGLLWPSESVFLYAVSLDSKLTVGWDSRCRPIIVGRGGDVQPAKNTRRID